MARQQQEWAKTKGTFSCAPSATQACKSSVQDSQASLHEIGACSLLCNSSNWARSMYEYSGQCRQSWDGRVYHRPSLLGTTSRRQLKHTHTESIKKGTAARCYGCWIHRSQPVVGSSSQSCSQNEELELVSLLQVLFLPSICPSTYVQPVLCLIAVDNSNCTFLYSSIRYVQSTSSSNLERSLHTVHKVLLVLVVLKSVL